MSRAPYFIFFAAMEENYFEFQIESFDRASLSVYLSFFMHI